MAGGSQVPDVQEAQREVARVAHWRHSIRLPGGVVTPGEHDTGASADYYGLPADLTGRSVLDIGCSDGYFSFEAERRGASRVLAIDDFSSLFVDSPSGFHVAHQLLNSQVEFRQMDLFDLDPDVHGQFDVVLFFGVLYHVRHPLLALERLAAVCGDQLIMETLVASRGTRVGRLLRRLVDDRSDRYMEFYERDEINRDPTTWWAPSPAAMLAMLRSCGFANVQAPRGTHGIFHAFHPRHGDDVDRLLSELGLPVVSQAASEILAQPVATQGLGERLKEVTIPQFAAIKQRSAELHKKQLQQAG